MAKLQLGVNDLGTVRPELAKQLVDPSEAKTVTKGSNKKLLWFCESGHPYATWEAAVFNRVLSYPSGCPYCSSKPALLVGWNDLATTHPELVEQLVDPSLAKTRTSGSDRQFEWWCDNGHPYATWFASPSTRANGNGCPYCYERVAIPGWNDLGTVRPDLAKQLVDPSLATTVTKGSEKKLLWFCETNHPRYEWEAAVAKRSQGYGCGVCTGQAVLVGWNDLKTINPELAKQLVDPSLATTVTKGSKKKLLWFCESGHPRYEWEAAVTNRSRGRGCPTCAKSGYDSSKPGVFYRFTFVENGDRFQVYGITNNWDKRKKNYENALRRKTWKMSDVQTLYFEDGKIPQQIESDFNKIRIPLLDEILPSQSEIKGTVEESFLISSPDSLELITVFEATWAEAQKLAGSELVPIH